MSKDNTSKETDNSYHATGKNYTAKTMRYAIEMFTLEFPNVDPIACVVKNE